MCDIISICTLVRPLLLSALNRHTFGLVRKLEYVCSPAIMPFVGSQSDIGGSHRTSCKDTRRPLVFIRRRFPASRSCSFKWYTPIQSLLGIVRLIMGEPRWSLSTRLHPPQVERILIFHDVTTYTPRSRHSFRFCTRVLHSNRIHQRMVYARPHPLPPNPIPTLSHLGILYHSYPCLHVFFRHTLFQR
jgi:hypothetical protein